jgi:hypothetical protein
MKRIIIALGILLISGCGGGGGGSTSTPTDPNQQFSLAQLQSTTLGTVYSTQITGSDSWGGRYTGALSIANRQQTMLGGVLVTPQDLLLSLSNAEMSLTVTGTTYFDSDKYAISLYRQTDGVTCTPSSPDKLPASVKIGDFGILSSLVCSDNTTQERNWRVEDAGNGNIHLISGTVIRNQFNSLVGTGEATATINAQGNIIAFKVVSTDVIEGFTLTVQSI